MNLNPIQYIQNSILNRFPHAKVTLDPGETADGSWFLDVIIDDYSLIVEWRPLNGIGLTANPEAGYGEGAEEIFHDINKAEKRVLELLLSKTKTMPTIATLSEIRRERRITQTELANSLRIQQASIAKLEKRSDILISTLQQVIRAMGGYLSIKAVFPDGIERDLCLTQGREEENSNLR